MVIWLVGLSASGKTTIGRELWKQWQATEPNTVFLDGDELRAVFGASAHPEPYSVEGRRANAERIAELCALLDRQGIHVVCAILSIFEDMREANRTRFSRYFEVFLDAPLETVERRDPKGLYAAARRGEMSDVVGVDIPFPTPTNPDLRIDNRSDDVAPSLLAARILAEALDHERPQRRAAELV